MTVKFIHCADIHLDTPFKGISRLNDKLAFKLKDINKRVLENIVDIAIRQKVDFILISGDLFDSEQKSLQSQLKSKKLFQRLKQHNIRVFAIGGNHDPLNKPQAIIWPDNVYFFPPGKPTTKEVQLQNHKIYIHGVSYMGRDELENKATQYPAPKSNGINIGLLHCDVGGGTERTYSPCTINDLKAKGYDYWALGHIHKKLTISREPYIIYPGSPQGKSIKEDGEKGCYMVTMNNSQWVLDFIQTHEVLWVQKDIIIDGLSIDSLYEILQETVLDFEKEINCKGVIIRFILRGKGELNSLTPSDLDEMALSLNEQENFHGKFAWVESIQKDTSPDIDLEILGKQNDFIGTLLKLEQDVSGDNNKLAELVSQLDILKNRNTKGYVGDIDENQLLRSARDMLLNQLLKE